MFSRLRNETAVPADQQSVVPSLRGVPWWGAVVIAVAITAVGAAIDADSRGALGTGFKVTYLLGCVLAALAVRRRALFTAAAQPPLVAFFVGIITLYTLNRDEAQGLRSVVLKVVLPIATSFPWMLLTFVLTLAVVIARWFRSRKDIAAQRAAEDGGSPAAEKPAPAKRAATTANTTAKTGSARTAADRLAEKQPAAKRPAAPQKATASQKPAPKPQPAATKTAPRPTAAAPAASATTTAVRKAPTAASQSRPARRAQPQTISAREAPAGREPQPARARTAGQRLREQDAIEDLTLGVDDPAPRPRS